MGAVIKAITNVRPVGRDYAKVLDDTNDNVIDVLREAVTPSSQNINDLVIENIKTLSDIGFLF